MYYLEQHIKHPKIVLEEALKFENQLANPSTPSAYRNRFVELYPEKAFDECGIGYAKTAVGDKYVYEYTVTTFPNC